VVAKVLCASADCSNYFDKSSVKGGTRYCSERCASRERVRRHRARVNRQSALTNQAWETELHTLVNQLLEVEATHAAPPNQAHDEVVSALRNHMALKPSAPTKTTKTTHEAPPQQTTNLEPVSSAALDVDFFGEPFDPTKLAKPKNSQPQTPLAAITDEPAMTLLNKLIEQEITISRDILNDAVDDWTKQHYIKKIAEWENADPVQLATEQVQIYTRIRDDALSKEDESDAALWEAKRAEWKNALDRALVNDRV